MSYEVVTDRTMIADAIDRLCRQLADGGEKVMRSLGYPSGNEKNLELIWRPADRIWAYIDANYPPGRYWCAYGTNIGSRKDSLDISVEINPPKEGVNRQFRGQILTNELNHYFLAHKGGLGGGRRGVVSMIDFCRHFQGKECATAVWREGGKPAKLHVIGRIGDPTLMSGLHHFIAEAERIRQRAREGKLG